MNRIPGLRRVFRLPIGRIAVYREIDEELQYHLDRRRDELIGEGMSPEAARARATAEFGDVAVIKHECRKIGRSTVRRIRFGEMLDTVRRDVAFAVRQCIRNPTFSLVAVVTLALGIGANTAIFSVVNGVLLEPLPYPEPHELIALRMTDPERGDRDVPWSLPNLRDFTRESRTFQSVTGYQWEDLTLTGVGEPELVDAVGVSGGLMRTLGTPPLLGRDIREDETLAGGPLVAVLSYAFWQERFGGDAAVVGRTVILSDLPFEVVGVAPQGFEFPRRAQLWVPGQWDPETHGRDRYFLAAVGRLARGSTIEMAQAEANAVAAALAEEYPESNASRGVALFSLMEYTVGDVRVGLLIMFGVVGLVLLIACFNVANLLLARGSMRVGEMATRATLGASRRGIVRQLIVESLMLSLPGTVLGVATAVWGVEALVALAPVNIPRLSNVAVDGTVIVFAAVVGVLVALVFGTAPAFRLASVSMSNFMRNRGHPEIGYRDRRVMPATLLTLEMALSLVLLVGAGLLLRSFAQIRAVELGFEPENVQQFTVTLPNSRYDDEQAVRFFASLERRLAALPGVAAVGMSSGSPLGRSHTSIGIDIIGRAPFGPGQQPFLLVRKITPGLLESLRIPLLSGRTFDAGDRADTRRVTLISRTAAERLFPDEDPVGKQFTFDPEASPWTIVGVVGDVRSLEVTTETPPEAYFPLAQWSARTMTVSVRGAARVSGLVPLLRSEVAALDPTLALYGVETLQHRVDISIGQERFYLFLLSLFAALALVLAAVGLYGVVAYLVSRRTREIGIRIALGARRNHVARLVLWQGMLPTAIGTAVGLLGAFAGTRVLASLLYQVEPWDAASFALATGVLSGAALLATFFPAVAALRVSPTEAIKAE